MNIAHAHKTMRSVIASPVRGNVFLTGIFLSVLYFDCFGGVLRYAFGTVGLALLLYVPFLFSFAYLFVSPFFVTKSYIHNPRTLILAPFFLLYLVYGILNLSSPEQGAFGFYVWAPFLLGFVYTSESDPQKLLGHFKWIWIIAVTGVLINYFVQFPWMGASFDMLGVSVDAARDWDAMGIKRLAGFSRASTTASAQIALFACCMFVVYKNRVMRFVIFALSFVAIFLTTSKVSLIGLVACYVFFTVGEILFGQESRKKVLFTYCWITLVSLIVLVVMVPLMYIGTNELDVSFGFSGDFSGDFSFLKLDSLFQRMTQMWPDAFNLITRDDAPLETVFGRGLGGIGSAQKFGEAIYINAADNLFVYLYVTYGYLSVLFPLFLMRGFSAFKNEKPIFLLLYASFLVLILVVGITSNIIESVCPMLVLGLVCGMTPRKKQDKAPLRVKCA